MILTIALFVFPVVITNKYTQYKEIIYTAHQEFTINLKTIYCLDVPVFPHRVVDQPNMSEMERVSNLPQQCPQLLTYHLIQIPHLVLSPPVSGS